MDAPPSGSVNRAVVVCGPPGAGKTTYGKRLAQRLGAVVVDIDTATEGLVRLALALSGGDPDDRDSPFFKRNFRMPIYQQMFAIARDNLPVHPVVLVGPFTHEMRDAHWPQTLSRALGAPVAIHYVRCAPEIRRQRLRARGNPRDRAKLDDWDRHAAYYGDESPPACVHRVVAGDGEPIDRDR